MELKNLNCDELGRLYIRTSIKQSIYDDFDGSLEKQENEINKIFETLNTDERKKVMRYINLYQTIGSYALTIQQEELKAVLSMNNLGNIIEDCRVTEEFFDLVYNTLPVEITPQIQTELLKRVGWHGLINYFIGECYSKASIKDIQENRKKLYNSMYTIYAFNVLVTGAAEILEIDELRSLYNDVDYIMDTVEVYNTKITELKEKVLKYDDNSIQGIFKDKKLNVLNNLLFPLDKNVYTPTLETFIEIQNSINNYIEKGTSLNIEKLLMLSKKQLESENNVWKEPKKQKTN